MTIKKALGVGGINSFLLALVIIALGINELIDKNYFDGILSIILFVILVRDAYLIGNVLVENK